MESRLSVKKKLGAFMVAVLVIISCNLLTPSDSVLGTKVAQSIAVTQTMEAEIQQRVQATLNAPTEKPANEPYTSSGITTSSDGIGNFQVPDESGGLVTMSLENEHGEKVVGAHILSAANEEGILLLIVPPPETKLLPKFVFVNKSQGRNPGIVLVSTTHQSLITIHLEGIESAHLIHETDAPPGLLEDLLSSPGWEKMVDTTHNLCEQLSIFSTWGSIAYISYGAARTLMTTMSLQQFAQLTIQHAPGIAGVGLTESFIQLCLAATGDPVGLSRLTGVVHKETGFGLILLDQPIPFIVSGRVTDSQTNEPLEGVTISTATYQVKSQKDGVFFISIQETNKSDLLLQKDGYLSQTISVTPSKDGYMHVGEISLASASTMFVEEFDDASVFSQTSDNVYISAGKVIWKISRNGGDQFIYRKIPSFTGNFRITVVGQIDEWTSNCSCGAGVGDSPGSGVAVHFGFYGGGCSTSGPFIGASGVLLNMQESNCQFTGRWPWILGKRPYKAILTIISSNATLSIESVGQVDGSVNYSGEYSILWVGNKGYGDWPSCSGSIESIIVEPLE